MTRAPAKIGPADAVAAYENDLAQHLGVRHVVATSSGTSAIHTALYAAGVGPGHEVLVPALSVVMSAAPILHLGARPVVIDCTAEGTGFDLADLERKTSPRTRAVLPVLMWGRADPAAAELHRYARAHGLHVIVDACQAIGTTSSGGRQAGLEATATCFSTHASKLLATGEGGFVTTDDDTIAAHARAYRSHWLPAPPGDQPLSRAAHNFRLAAPLADIGRRELTRIDQLLQRRRRQTRLLLDQLADSPHLHPPALPDGWNAYSPLVTLRLPRGRAFCEHLAARDVPNSTGTFGLIPLDQRPAFRDPSQPSCPNAAALLDSTLAIALGDQTDIITDSITDDSAEDDRIHRYAATITQEAARWAMT